MVRSNFFATLKERVGTEGRILPMDGGALGVFDAQVALTVNADNFQDLVLPDRSVLARFKRPKPPLYWEEVRKILLEQMSKLYTSENIRDLYGRMRKFCENNLDRELDLTWFTQRLISNPLVPLLIDGANEAEYRSIIRDQNRKIGNIVEIFGRRIFIISSVIDVSTQLLAGLSVSRILRRRLSNRCRSGNDLADAILGFEEPWGRVRMTYVLTTVLTAISGAPGSVAACLLFEIMNKPDWMNAIRLELSRLSVDEICQRPIKNAPVTYRFVREVLRVWTVPMMVSRPVHKTITVDGHILKPGQFYLLSSYLTHRDQTLWNDADKFDPDRWLNSSGAIQPGAYVPFGWAPRTCVGSALGSAQLILLCHLLLTQFVVEPIWSDRAEIKHESIALPINFRGKISLT